MVGPVDFQGEEYKNRPFGAFFDIFISSALIQWGIKKHSMENSKDNPFLKTYSLILHAGKGTKAKLMSTQYSLHEIVWVKCKGHPWWPAKINKVTIYQNNVTVYRVSFYASNEYAEVFDEHMAAYDSFFFASSIRRANPFLNRAILYAERARNKQIAKIARLNEQGKTNPIIPKIKFITFSYKEISIEKDSSYLSNSTNFKPLSFSTIQEESPVLDEEICKNSQQIPMDLSSKKDKLRQFCRKLYKLFKDNGCNRPQSQLFCLKMMRKIEQSWSQNEDKLSHLITYIKREFSKVGLAFEEMQARAIELFNQTMPSAKDSPLSLTEP